MKNKEEIIGRVVEILNRSFSVIDRCYEHNDESSLKDANFEIAGSRIIFPSYSRNYRKAKRRFSEQELRFVFLEQFNEYCKDPDTAWDVYYSVETPTEWKYKFSKADKPHKTDDGSGESASFDVCIHDKTGKRICMIEFKAGNPEPSHYIKDFVKQANEVSFEKGEKKKHLPQEEVVQFFVHILERQYSNTETKIHEKIRKYLLKNYTPDDIKKMTSIIYVCHTIEKHFKGTKCTWIGDETPSNWKKETIWDEIKK